MTGLNLKASYTDFGVSPMMQALVGRYSDLTPLMDDFGQVLENSTVERFETNIAPDGSPWLPSERVLKAQGSAKILVDKADLRNSITTEPSAREVQVGSNLPYAAIHQSGGQAGRNLATYIEPRPYLGISEEDEQDLFERVTDYWVASFGNAGPSLGALI